MLVNSSAHMDALIRSEHEPPSFRPAVVRSMLDVFSSLTGGQSSSVPPEPRSLRQTGPSFPHKARGILQPLRPAMKQTLSELMRMSRICRMIFATCLGSFILVIFYFQSMFQPGRISLLFFSRVCECVLMNGILPGSLLARRHIDLFWLYSNAPDK